MRTGRSSSPPMTACTASSSGRATAPPAPCSSRTSPAPTSSYPRLLTNVNGTLFFMADDGATGDELWKSDGTAAAPCSSRTSAPAPSSDRRVPPSRNARQRERDAVLHRRRWVSGGIELWKSDGTEPAPCSSSDIAGPGGSLLCSVALTSVNGTLFFTRHDGVNGSELWKSDGTAAGTVLVKRHLRPVRRLVSRAARPT